MPNDTERAVVYHFADYQFDCRSLHLWRGNTQCPLTPLCRKLLLALLEKAPGVLFYNDICNQVWEGRPVSGETIIQRVKLLRQSLGDSGSHPKYIELVRGEGYAMIPTVKRTEADKPFSPVPSPPRISRRFVLPLYLIALAMVMVLTGHAIWQSNLFSPPQANVTPLRAEEAYKSAMFFYHRRAEGDMALAEEYLSKALLIYPDYVDALVSMAGLYNIRYEEMGNVDRNTSYRVQTDLLHRALKLDPNAAEAHARLAMLHWCDSDRRKAVRHLESAYALAPDTPLVLNLYASYLAASGKQRRAWELMQEAIALQPNSFVNRINLALKAMADNELDIAGEQLQELLKRYPPSQNNLSVSVARWHILRGEPQQAAHYVSFIESDNDSLAIRALIAHLRNDTDALEKRIEQLSALDSTRAQFQLAEVLAFKGDMRRATDLTGSLYQTLTRDSTLPRVDRVRLLIDMHISPFLRRGKNLWRDKINALDPFCPDK